MNEIRVVNRHHGKWPNRRYMHIGRPSVLGNPFHIGSDGTREEVITMYRKWLIQHIETGTPTIIAELDRIATWVMDDSNMDICLQCYCAPQACHGDVIKEVIEQVIKANQ